MQFTKKTILIGAAAAIGIAAIGGTAVAATGVVGSNDRDARHAEFEQELAQKLGVPQADVAKALDELHAERTTGRLDALVQEGRLTQQQADAIQQQAQAGDAQGAMRALRTAMLGNALADLVEAGEITQAQADEAAKLAAEGVPIGVRGMKRADGDRPTPDAGRQQEHLEHLQQEGAITAQQAAEIAALITAGEADEAQQRLHALRSTEHLAELVEDGAITQAQADRVQALIDAGAPIGLGGPGMGGPKGHRGGGDHLGDGGGRQHGDHGDHHGMDDGEGREPGGAAPALWSQGA